MTPAEFVTTWRQRVKQDVATDPVYAAQLYEILNGLNDPAAPATALDDLVTQPPRGVAYDLNDAAALYEVALNLNLGWTVIALISPGQGWETAAPSRRHAPALPAPFLTTRSHDGSLHLRWTENITMSHAALADRQITVTYPPGEVPLALGSIAPGFAIWELRRSGGLDRQPSGHHDTSIILSTRPQPGLSLAPPTFIEGAPVIAA